MPFHETQRRHRKPSRELLACGLWLRAAFVGASATGVALVGLIEGEWSVMSAMAMMVAGVALTVFSYRRSRGALGDAGRRIATAATSYAAHR